MMEVANRLHSVEEYYFSKKLKEVNTLKSQGKPIINLGIGSPDLQPPSNVIKAISESFKDANAHTYQSYQGLPELRSTIAGFYKIHFNVDVNANTEVLPLIGSKEGIMHISMAFLNKGDAVLIPNLSYPTYTAVTKLLEAKPIFYTLDEAHNWCPNIEELEKQDLNKVKIMWLNYPHMPTGVRATKAIFKKLIVFAKKHNILLVNDNPYSFILNSEPLSILSVDGSKEMCLELNSLSKTFNMAGWRVGMLLGNNQLLNAVLKVKSNMDSGMFYGIQKGAIEALQTPKYWLENLNLIYQERRELVWELAAKLNCTYDENTSGLFVWAKLPSNLTSEAFIDKLLNEHSVFIAPGTIFGSQGEGYVRFSLCAKTEEIKEAITRV
ncbi:MAG: aminotransferase class I/II-fold pyridoxal phosphate-dependent enzyme [Lacinutrix sp.]|uniref:pyridoxal phosphate-dependent aminotransferase n=1 Tax=Lacinutrix sp. TaxID=1937692 RepID=UPI003099C0F9